MNKRGRIFISIFFSVIIILVMVFTNGRDQFKSIYAVFYDLYAKLTVEIRYPDVDLLDEAYASNWGGNAQIIEFHGQDAVRVIENGLSEARILYNASLDFTPLERVEFSVYQKEQSRLPKIVFGIKDVDGNVYSHVVEEKLLFNEWHKYILSLQELVRELNLRAENIRLDQIGQLWISSISPEKDRIVFYVKDFYFFNKEPD